MDKSIDKYFKSSIITNRCHIPINNLSNNISDTLLNSLKNEFENKCTNHGFISSNSINILDFSLGLMSQNTIIYDVTFEAQVCYPVQDDIYTCIIENITKAGIKAVVTKQFNPMVIFVPRDLHLDHEEFNSLTQDDIINVKIIGTRFEMYDKYISAIANYLNKV